MGVRKPVNGFGNVGGGKSGDNVGLPSEGVQGTGMPNANPANQPAATGTGPAEANPPVDHSAAAIARAEEAAAATREKLAAGEDKKAKTSSTVAATGGTVAALGGAYGSAVAVGLVTGALAAPPFTTIAVGVVVAGIAIAAAFGIIGNKHKSNAENYRKPPGEGTHGVSAEQLNQAAGGVNQTSAVVKEHMLANRDAQTGQNPGQQPGQTPPSTTPAAAPIAPTTQATK